MSFLKPLEFKECIIDSPFFREKLVQHEKEVNYSVKVFKDIFNSLKKVYKSIEDCSSAFKELAENLKKFTLNVYKNDTETINGQVETEDEKEVRNAVEMYSELINNIEKIRREQLCNVAKESIMKDLQKLKEECLSRSKKNIKEFKKITANYYMKLDKYSATKYKPDVDYENIDADFQEDRLQYVSKALTHVMNIQDTEEQKTFRFVNTFGSFIEMLNSYHMNAWNHMEEKRNKIKEIKGALQRTQENYTSIAKETEKLKQKMLSFPIEHIQPDLKNQGEIRREGYLFVLTKKSVMSDLWTRKFCIYERNSRKLKMIQVTLSIQNNAPRMQSEEYQLISCERKISSTIDRRFSFDINIKNALSPLTLQALTKEDLTQWMMIMDGQEPIYAQPINNFLNQEPETIINDKVIQYMSKCFSEIEKRGLDSEGLYRSPGFMAQRDIILKKIISDIEKSSLEIKCERDLELLDVHTLCSVVKAYIKYLKIPMATYVLYEEFIEAGKLLDIDEKFTVLLKLVRKLPSDNFHLFFLLIKHLNKISQNHEQNLMTSPNLAVCFSPTIFRPALENTSITAIREAKFAANIVSFLIERCNDFFPDFNSYRKPSFNQLKPLCEKGESKICSMETKPYPEPRRGSIPTKPSIKKCDTDNYYDKQKKDVTRPPIIARKPTHSLMHSKSENAQNKLLDENNSESQENENNWMDNMQRKQSTD